jgi:aminopeptidase N
MTWHMFKRFLVLFLALLPLVSLHAQPPQFTRADTLRGSITPERAWWDLTYYHLEVAVDPEERYIRGSNLIRYRVREPQSVLQIDLQAPLHIDRVTQNGHELAVESVGNAHFIRLAAAQPRDSLREIRVEYSGQPQTAQNPPWDGGLVWAQDSRGQPFIANANQGAGASIWWPCKDHPYDEVDSMAISVRVPAGLMDVSNGRLRAIEEHDNGDRTFHWFVTSPINNYGVNINIADYVHFGEIYAGEDGPLDCDYYVLRDNLAQAREQFREVPRMLEAFEYWFGPYPFYADGYKLVEVPYLGMEHQSSVTYGNGYQNGYRGRDLSQTGWGLTFDFIIVHESGHEWFANSITYRDAADMWIHESFTNYSESLFLDYHEGTPAANAYVQGLRTNIENRRPVQSPYRNVARSGSGDMYYKGSNMLHLLRQLVGDDERWRQILRDLQATFRHQTVDSETIENFLAEATGLNLAPFFDQYLRDTRIPTLEYRFWDDRLIYRWSNVVPGFAMPVRVTLNGEQQWLEPTERWQELNANFGRKELLVDPNFYVATLNLTVAD